MKFQAKTEIAALALLRVWRKEALPTLIEVQKEHIELLKAEVLEEREYSSTVYCGWGTTVDNAYQELYEFQDMQNLDNWDWDGEVLEFQL